MQQPEWTALISQDDGWWIGWINEIPGVNAQERTRAELLKTLAKVLDEALEMKPPCMVASLSRASCSAPTSTSSATTGSKLTET